MIRTIAFNELQRRLLSPGFWLLLAGLFFLLGLLLLSLLENYVNTIQPANLQKDNPTTLSDGLLLPYFWWSGLLVPALMPLFAMNAVANERQHHTWILLQAAPVTRTSLLLGKFIGLLVLATLVIFCVALPAALLSSQAVIDTGQFLSSIAGLWLLAMTAAAIGLYFATALTDSLASVLASYTLLIFLGLLYLLANLRGVAGSLVHQLASYTHFTPWLNGLFDTRHLLYFLLLTLFFIALTLHSARYEHLRGH